MENVLAFLRAAAPWISLGLLIAFFCVRPTVKKGKSESAEGDYAVDGMCIGKAASEVKEFYLLPVGRELLQYDSLAVNTIVKNKSGEVSSCDVPFSSDLAQFNADHLRLTREVAERCANYDLIESMAIGTSAIIDTEIDGAVGMNSGIFNNPFLIWDKYHKGLFKTTLTLSFQFHHTQMDGAHAGRFLKFLQDNITDLKLEKYKQNSKTE